jgi:hypothetical protein
MYLEDDAWVVSYRLHGKDKSVKFDTKRDASNFLDYLRSGSAALAFPREPKNNVVQQADAQADATSDVDPFWAALASQDREYALQSARIREQSLNTANAQLLAIEAMNASLDDVLREPTSIYFAKQSEEASRQRRRSTLSSYMLVLVSAGMAMLPLYFLWQSSAIEPGAFASVGALVVSLAAAITTLLQAREWKRESTRSSLKAEVTNEAVLAAADAARRTAVGVIRIRQDSGDAAHPKDSTVD